jgi:hypothetical protein
VAPCLQAGARVLTLMRETIVEVAKNDAKGRFASFRIVETIVRPVLSRTQLKTASTRTGCILAQPQRMTGKRAPNTFTFTECATYNYSTSKPKVSMTTTRTYYIWLRIGSSHPPPSNQGPERGRHTQSAAGSCHKVLVVASREMLGDIPYKGTHCLHRLHRIIEELRS